MGSEKRRFGPLVAVPRERPSPFLKWAGGKGRLIKRMQGWFPAAFEVYLEPFLGGGAVFFHLLPGKAILGDLNGELINAYKVVRDDPERLMEALDKHEPSKGVRKYYYQVRDWEPDDLTPVERAARTIFLNRTCYNGLYRVNSKGGFNVPFGQYENPQLYARKRLLACSHALQGKRLMAADFQETLVQAGAGDFVYLDPPYQPVSPTANFTAYTKGSFGEEDQRHLAKVFGELDRRGCLVMLSNSATSLVRKLYGEYQIHSIKAPRAISSDAATRGEVDEVLVRNYKDV